MARLTFGMMASLDGYINDARGDFNWGQIADDVHAHANEEGRRIDLDIYGRRMYETMVYWETHDGGGTVEADYARVWQTTDKLVVSKRLTEVASRRTTLVPDLDIAAVRKLKTEREGLIAISGPTIAAGFLDAGLVDEVSVYCIPVVVGAGTPMFQVRKKLRLERIEEQSFGNGVNFMRYRVQN